MKTLLWISFVFCFGVTNFAFGQIECEDSDEVILNSSDWDWEVPEDSVNYCEAWTVFLERKNDYEFIGAPWNGQFQGGIMTDVKAERDYKKSDGWVLLARKFGYRGPRKNYPWFILYNKHLGFLRLFVYLGGDPGTSWSHVVAKLKHGRRGNTSSLLSHASREMIAPNEYLPNENIGEDENILYNSFSAPNEWALFEFDLTYDPNIGSEPYRGAALEIEVYGLENSKLEINGRSVEQDHSFATNQKTIDQSSEGETIEKVTGVFKEIAKGDDYVSKANEFAKEVEESDFAEKSPIVRNFGQALRAITDSTSTLSKVVKTISALSEVGGQIGGFIGAAIKLFSRRRTSYNRRFTVHEFSGTIETIIPIITDISINVPGSLKEASLIDNNPLYDRPLGIFNIEKTPLLEGVEFIANVNTPAVPMISHRVAEPIELNVNTSSDLVLISSQAAIVGRVQLDSRNKPKYDPFHPHLKNRYFPYGGIESYLNFMLADFQAGRLVLINMEEETGRYEFQSPFVDLDCFQGMAFNVPATTDVFVRVKCIFAKAPYSDNSEPIQIVHDYKVNVNFENVVSANPVVRWRFWRENPPLPPFSNYDVPYTGRVQSDAYIDDPFDLFSNIEVSNSISVTNLRVPYRLPYYKGFRYIRSLTLRAGNSIKIKPPFIVTDSGYFNATVDYGFKLPCKSFE